MLASTSGPTHPARDVDAIKGRKALLLEARGLGQNCSVPTATISANIIDAIVEYFCDLAGSRVYYGAGHMGHSGDQKSSD